MIHRVTPKADLLTSPIRGSEPAEAPAKKPRASGKQAESESTPSQPIGRATVDRTVATVSEVLKAANPRLKFEIDDATDRVVVKIVKGDSGEVIRQIPPEELLELEKYLSSAKGLLLREQA
jgi:flagellar protein FlaG